MKFFTLDWWTGDSEADPHSAYAAHVASIRHLLPADLLALHERNPLHDARLRDLRLDVTAGELVLSFDAADENGGFGRRLRLAYRGVTLFRSAADPARGLGGPHGYGDLGYDEIDTAGDGTFEHRLLFSSGVELQVQFRHFGWEDDHGDPASNHPTT